MQVARENGLDNINEEEEEDSFAMKPLQDSSH